MAWKYSPIDLFVICIFNMCLYLLTEMNSRTKQYRRHLFYCSKSLICFQCDNLNAWNKELQNVLPKCCCFICLKYKNILKMHLATMYAALHVNLIVDCSISYWIFEIILYYNIEILLLVVMNLFVYKNCEEEFICVQFV